MRLLVIEDVHDPAESWLIVDDALRAVFTDPNCYKTTGQGNRGAVERILAAQVAGARPASLMDNGEPRRHRPLGLGANHERNKTQAVERVDE